MNTILRLLLVAFFAVAAIADDAGNTCYFWGDPHIRTFDGVYYSYQDPGWHHIIISSKINIQANFVPGCYSPIPTNACAKDMRIFVLDDNNVQTLLEVFLSDDQQDGYYQVFEGSSWYKILLNGQESGLHSLWSNGQLTYPETKPGVALSIGVGTNAYAFYYLAQSNTIFQLQFQFNDDIVVSHIPDVLTITPTGTRSNSLWQRICGLCGSFDGSGDNDFIIHDTSYHTIDVSNDNIDRFANTWSVDYQVPGGNQVVLAPASKAAVYQCFGGPNPTPAPTTPPTPSTPTPTRTPPTNPPTTTPTPSPTTPSTSGTPSPAPTPAPTQPPTDRPTPSPTSPSTPQPTNPATQPPTLPPTITPTPAPTTTPSNNTYNADNNTAITNAEGTQIYQDALVACDNAGLQKGDPMWPQCMYDVTQTNTTSLAVASAGALALAGCAQASLNDTTCTAGTLFACPGACNANGKCVAGACLCNKGYEGLTCTKAPLLTAAQLAGVISAGAVAGIAIGAAAFAGLAGFGAKKGYDYYQMKDNKMANVNSNPLYNEKKTGGVSPLYAEKA